MMKHLCLWVMLVLTVYVGKAQHSGSYRSKNITLNADSLLIDTNVIVQNSVTIFADNNTLLKEGVDYYINYFTGYLKVNVAYQNKPLQLSYKTPNINFKQVYSNKSRSLQIPEIKGNRYDLGYAPAAGGRIDLFKNDGLKLNGSISRGLGFGNNQEMPT
ncbi:MAG: hypothetical protein ACK44D_06405 [Bacteroidia bacterium]